MNQVLPAGLLYKIAAERASPIFSEAESRGFGELHLFSDATLNLRAVIAIHSTARGPALGGCRLVPYLCEQDAITDALHLAEAMSYKAAITGLSLGGGKAVLIKPKQIPDRAAYFNALGYFIETLKGRFIAAEDSGTDTFDMDAIATATSHVRGTSSDCGDPSPTTAKGVCIGIQTAVRHIFGSDSLHGLHVLIQGAGHVGFQLAAELSRRGVRLSVSDIDQEAAQRCADSFGAQLVAPENLLHTHCDIFAPCALGGSVNRQLLEQLDCRIIAGSANNQLASPDIDKMLLRTGKLYAPDYVINAGGLIRVALKDEHEVEQRLAAIGDTLEQIFNRSRLTGIGTGEIADQMAMHRLNITAGAIREERPA